LIARAQSFSLRAIGGASLAGCLSNWKYNKKSADRSQRHAVSYAIDPASHKCTMMHSQPAAPMKSMGGPFKTEAEAHKAMASMKECEG
jgi:hypothetical protein